MIKNILAIRNDRFGELLLNIPALRALKEAHPQARLSLAVSSLAKELARAIECVDEVVVWDDKFRRSLGKQKFDLCVVLNPTKEAHWAIFQARIPMRVGYNRKLGFLLTHKTKDLKYLGNKHEVDYNLELVGLIGANTLDKTLALKVDESLYSELVGQKIIAIHPFTSDPVKQWPIERFQELARRLVLELNVKVVVVGSLEANIHFQEGVMNMINKTSLVELAVLLKRCSLLISGDSGPVHLAAAVGTPTVVLFRNDLLGKTAQRWGPWGNGHIVIEKNNLESISVEEVLEKIKNIRSS